MSSDEPTQPADLLRPRWGEATLAEIGPALLRSLEVDSDGEQPGGLQLPPAARWVVLLVDGLGLVDLRGHAPAAPYLSSLPTQDLTAGFPSTTVSSLTSLATGLPSGEHGLPGYTTWDVDRGQALHWLGWHPVGSAEDLREELPPEVVQPHPTTWERAAEAGVAVTVVNSRRFEGTGLTRAAFRGGRYVGVVSDGDAVAATVTAADQGHRSLVYDYLSQLDLMGHVRGPGSEPWLAELTLVDRYVELLARRLPADARLLITGDHGMVALDPEQVVDADDTAPGAVGEQLRQDVLGLAGEPRMRHVHVRAGAAGDVLARWRELLGDLAWVLSGDQAVQLGLFGPRVAPAARSRIGDVVAISRDRSAVVQRRRESRMSAMPGHHGSLTDRDLLVPLALTGQG